MPDALPFIEVCSYLAAGATVYAFSAKTIVPLRGAAIVANGFFIIYGLGQAAYATLILHTILLPLNVVRLRSMLRLIRSVREAASSSDFSMDWLRPYMKVRYYSAGTRPFSKGDLATEAFYIVKGEIELEEIRATIGPGIFFGEMGLFTTGNQRTVTARCTTDVKVLFITYDEFRQLFFQQPSFGFFVLRLIVQRMEQNLELARQSGPRAGRANEDVADRRYGE